MAGWVPLWLFALKNGYTRPGSRQMERQPPTPTNHYKRVGLKKLAGVSHSVLV